MSWTPFQPEPSAQAPWTRTIFRTRWSSFCAESAPQVNSNTMQRDRDVPRTPRIGVIELLILLLLLCELICTPIRLHSFSEEASQGRLPGTARTPLFRAPQTDR